MDEEELLLVDEDGDEDFLELLTASLLVLEDPEDDRLLVTASLLVLEEDDDLFTCPDDLPELPDDCTDELLLVLPDVDASVLLSLEGLVVVLMLLPLEPELRSVLISFPEDDLCTEVFDDLREFEDDELRPEETASWDLRELELLLVTVPVRGLLLLLLPSTLVSELLRVLLFDTLDECVLL